MHINGFTLLRILSDREHSKVHLARDGSGALYAVKLQRPGESVRLADLAARNKRLQPLSQQTGLLPILSHGTTEDGWAWKSLPLADNLPGLPPLTDEAGLQQYTPLTLRAWTTERGGASAELVARWGMRLAGALTVLHGEGLVHRDVKPVNILFVQGEPCLGDYGLVGGPGDKLEFNGTEGFRPLEGTNDISGDLFALGKTLYEAWTAQDRLEFPSMPRTALDAPDWNVRGSQLNQIILRACHAQPRNRFHSAAELSAALAPVVSGQRPINRRRWLLAALGLAGVATSAVVLPKLWRAPARLTWRRVRAKGFDVELWQGHSGTADWARNRIFSVSVGMEGCVFQSFDLNRFTLEKKLLLDGPKYGCSSIFHPPTGKLWAIERGLGEVFALDLETEKFSRLGGGPGTDRHYEGRTYWNPITQRVGVFGGYGHFAMTNERSEFDAAAGRWVQVEPDREGSGPCRRTPGMPLIPDAANGRVFIVGGYGSRSGKQGELDVGAKNFDKIFHYLDDVWELDLRKNTWRCLLPPGHLDPQRLRAAAYFPNLKGLVIFEGMKLGDNQPGPASAWLLRPDVDRVPVRLPAGGDTSRLVTAWSWTLDPHHQELVLLASDGIFRISAKGA